MSEQEKRAAEWEARHFAAARGPRGDAGALQHYLSHTRFEESCAPPAGAHTASTARRTAAGGARITESAAPRTAGQDEADARSSQSWLARLGLGRRHS
jgi:hypothetical protein